jgi:ABC-type polysaccharide/polyol phosphate export permease
VSPVEQTELWTVRTPQGARVCRRAGEGWAPARTPWLRAHAALLRLFVGNDFRARYRAQAMGVVWSLLQPLVMMSILSLVFSRLRASEPRYPVLLLIGLLTWQWASQALNAATISFVLNADMVKRTVFPRALLPLASVLSYGMNAMVESLVLLALIPFFPFAFKLTPALLVILPLLGCLVLMLAGAAVAAAVLNVVYRDVAYLVSTGLLILYWLTPIIYLPTDLPPRFARWLAWNPLAGIITGLRGAISDGTVPDALDWLRILGPTFVIVLTGVIVFRHFEREMLDHV